MYRIAVCDDEKNQSSLFAEYVERYCCTEGLKGEISIYQNAGVLLNHHHSDPFDIILLDIEMPGIDGITAAKRLNSFPLSPYIIFITSHHNYVRDAFEVKAFQYLEKPIRYESVKRVMDRVIEQYTADHRRYSLTYKGLTATMLINDILFLESKRWMIILHTVNGERYEFRGKLSDEESLLSAYGFVRVHQSFLVNMDYITKVCNDGLWLKDSETMIPISRKYKPNFVEKFAEFRQKKMV